MDEIYDSEMEEVTDQQLDTNSPNNAPLVKENLPFLERNNAISDEDLWESDKVSLAKHNDEYSKLLETYVKNTEKSWTFKYTKKHEIYNISMGLFITAPILMFLVIILSLLATICNPEIGAVDLLPEILTAFCSVVATYIAIIKLITEYIFNKSEDEIMKEIIGKIQQYDMQLRGNNPQKEEKTDS